MEEHRASDHDPVVAADFSKDTLEARLLDSSQPSSINWTTLCSREQGVRLRPILHRPIKLDKVRLLAARKRRGPADRSK